MSLNSSDANIESRAASKPGLKENFKETNNYYTGFNVFKNE